MTSGSSRARSADAGRHRAPFQQVEPLPKPIEKLPRTEHRQPCRRQLDRERQSLQPRAQLDDDRVPAAAATDAKELDRLLAHERRQRKLDLPLHAQQLSAGDKERQLRAGAQQLGQLRCSRDYLLQVVDQQQHPARPDVRRQPVPCTDRLRDGLDDQLRIAQRRQRHPEDAVREARQLPRRKLDRESRLACTAWPADG
jgi:hypothetical protein